MSTAAPAATGQKPMAKVIRRILAIPLVLLIALFVPAGTFDFWQAWVYIGFYCAAAIAFVTYFHFRDPQLLARRMLREETVWQQKIILFLLKANYSVMLVLCGFDHQFGWSERWLMPVPAWLTLVALALLIGCQFLFAQVMIANRFAASVIQVEAGQSIANTGPYRLVRHPMYAVGIVQNCVTPLALGSFVVWPLCVLLVPILAWRLLNEEKLLRVNLPGYPEYCKQTQYRLFPGVW